MPLKRILLPCFVLVTTVALLSANLQKGPASGQAMVKAAQAFLKTLTPEQRKLANEDYGDPDRVKWHFIPKPTRPGVEIKHLEGKSLRAAHALLRSGLSEAGYDQTLNVMSLEEILYLLEGGNREERRSKRDPLKYFITIFGEPSENGTWGWRVEGHHVSLNYSIADGKVVASTPEFFGANPGTVDTGPGRQIRVLGAEEDLARQILKLCNAKQEKVTWLDKKAPDDLRGGGVAQPETTDPVGISYANMSPDQKKLMQNLLTEYLQNMPADVEAERRAKINKAGLGNIHFAWWGSSEQNERHYYRVQGPTFLIEYNNTQNSANHVHSIWRDMSGDFNVPLKAKG